MPIVHKSSFEVAGADILLLLSVLVVRAVRLFPRDTYFMVPILDTIELVKHCIFEINVFRRIQDLETKKLGQNSADVLPMLRINQRRVPRH